MIKRLFSRKHTAAPGRKKMLTEDEAWSIWKGCGKLAGVDYYDYATKIIRAYEQKNARSS